MPSLGLGIITLFNLNITIFLKILVTVGLKLILDEYVIVLLSFKIALLDVTPELLIFLSKLVVTTELFPSPPNVTLKLYLLYNISYVL